jgi:ribosomal protein S18 acetylase RimI-like enzyme
VNLAPPLRAATPGDAPALAELINFAGEGLPLFLWGRMAEPGETAWDVGRRRARRDEGGFSWRNATVAEPEGGAVAACLIGYPLPEAPEPIDPARTPPMFVPLEELERLAPGTWYVNVLAAYPRWRDRGLGTALLGLADRLAAGAGCHRRGTSIVVADTNVGARRLYGRCGYRERARRAMVKDGWDGPGAEWVLLVREPVGVHVPPEQRGGGGGA